MYISYMSTCVGSYVEPCSVPNTVLGALGNQDEVDRCHRIVLTLGEAGEGQQKHYVHLNRT